MPTSARLYNTNIKHTIDKNYVSDITMYVDLGKPIRKVLKQVYSTRNSIKVQFKLSIDLLEVRKNPGSDIWLSSTCKANSHVNCIRICLTYAFDLIFIENRGNSKHEDKRIQLCINVLAQNYYK